MKQYAGKPTWSALKRRLRDLRQPELQALVKDLFELSADNRAFLAARYLSDAANTAGGSVALPFRQRIHDAFYDKGGRPRTRLGLAAARKAIRDYRKATADADGTLELMLTYVETGTEFSLDFGAEEPALFDSLSSILSAIETELDGPDGTRLYGRYRERLLDVAERAGRIGWGYGDFVREIVAALEHRWAKPAAP